MGSTHLSPRYSSTREGAPQGGPLSLLPSNICLDKLDKEPEAKGLRFCRYADDSLILVRTPRAAERVCESVTRFIEKELKLRVNREKTEIGSPRNLKFLGCFVQSVEGAQPA